MAELTPEQMAKVTGGANHTINTGVEDLDAALRAEPRKASKQIDHISNGTAVNTISDELVYDPVAQRHFVQVEYNGKIGWVASSILGLRR